MPSGGSRRGSGPPPDPNALRRDRAGDRDWTTLPAEGRKGRTPAFPLLPFRTGEKNLWAALWKKPQAVQWEKLGMHWQVAAYVRAFLESVEPEASAGLKTAVLRMEGEVGLSLPGMHSLRWKISEDELRQKRVERKSQNGEAPSATGARARLKAVTGGA